MFNTVYSFLSFTLYVLLCPTMLGLVLYYLAIQPLAARECVLLNQLSVISYHWTVDKYAGKSL